VIEENVFQICAVVETMDTAVVATIVSVRPVKLPG